MFDFSTLTPGVVSFIQSALGLITPTSLIGGIVVASITASLMVKVVQRVKGLVR